MTTGAESSLFSRNVVSGLPAKVSALPDSYLSGVTAPVVGWKYDVCENRLGLQGGCMWVGGLGSGRVKQDSMMDSL